MKLPKTKRSNGLTDEQRAEVWNSVKRALRSAEMLRECGLLLEAVLCKTTKQHKLYLAEGITWEGFCEQMELAPRTLTRYFAAAEFVESWARATYRPQADSVFVVTEQMVMHFVKARRAANQSYDLKSLIGERAEAKKLAAALNGESLTENGFTSYVKDALSVKVAEAPAKPPVVLQDDLFYLHDRLTNAGFAYDGERKKYINADGSAITTAQMAPFIDEGIGLKIFEETIGVIEPARRDLANTIGRFRMYLHAYMESHQSPNDRKRIEAKHSELQSSLLAMLHEVDTLLVPPESL